MSGASTGKPPVWKRLIPVVKIGVAAALIAFLLWLVPIKDHLYLMGASPAEDRAVIGNIESREVTDGAETAQFRAQDGARYEVGLDADTVLWVAVDGVSGATPLAIAAQYWDWGEGDDIPLMAAKLESSSCFKLD